MLVVGSYSVNYLGRSSVKDGVKRDYSFKRRIQMDHVASVGVEKWVVEGFIEISIIHMDDVTLIVTK